MAVRIRNFSHQKMFINTPFSLNIRITGGPTNVRVDGLPDNLYYHWNGSRNRVQIRGTPERLTYNKEMVVTADDQQRRQTYSVVPFLPTFDQNIRQRVIKGVPFTLPVQVDSTHSYTEVKGPYIGLDWDVEADGFYLYGMIPENANFTQDEFVFDAMVSNFSGETRGTITLLPEALSDVRFYILDGNIVKVYQSVIPIEGIEQTVMKVKEFNLPSIPGTAVTNYVALANDGTNLYALHSAGPSTNSDDLDDQVVVVSPATQNGQTAGIIRRFTLTRTSHYYDHEIDDFFYDDGKLYIITSWGTESSYQSYFVLYTIDGSDVTRIISLNARGGGICLTQSLLTAVLYERASPNQGNYFRIYPPSWATGSPRIADSYQSYTTHGVIREDFAINTNDISMTSINNFAYILSSTLRDVVSVVEVPTPVGTPIRRGEIELSPGLTQPNGITAI
ncbi:hypothetical protein F4X90_21825 [Candidatus Poribacteria bacterium]|nr:hypothetical protein [Candidatus Poribacteria bacterium]